MPPLFAQLNVRNEEAPRFVRHDPISPLKRGMASVPNVRKRREPKETGPPADCFHARVSMVGFQLSRNGGQIMKRVCCLVVCLLLATTAGAFAQYLGNLSSNPY